MTRFPELFLVLLVDGLTCFHRTVSCQMMSLLTWWWTPMDRPFGPNIEHLEREEERE